MLRGKQTEKEKKNNKDRYRQDKTVILTNSKKLCPQLPFVYFIYGKKYSIFEVQQKWEKQME